MFPCATDFFRRAGRDSSLKRRHEQATRRGKSAMSNGTDLSGAVGACRATRREVREMHVQENSAKVHHQQADKETQNAKKAVGIFSKLRHEMEAIDEQNKGDAAKRSADQHLKDANKHLGEYNAAMARWTPLPAKMGRDGPDCGPVERAASMVKEHEDALHKMTMDAINSITP
jgi:hypothetical protein